MSEERRRFERELRARHPRVAAAIAADARIALRMRVEGHDFGSRLQAVMYAVRLCVASDAFLALALYRVKARLQALGIPVLPRIAHRAAMLLAGVSIGDPVSVAPGVYIVHGQVVIDGIVSIGSGVVISPFVTIGLRAGNFVGPVIEDGVHIGAGAQLIGPIHVGAGATIGAGAVVVHDVAPGITVAGVPARPL